MTIGEAIKIKEDTLYKRYLHHPEKVELADKISIEALGRLEDNRNNLGFPHTMLLPGETKD